MDIYHFSIHVTVPLQHQPPTTSLNELMVISFGLVLNLIPYGLLLNQLSCPFWQALFIVNHCLPTSRGHEVRRVGWRHPRIYPYLIHYLIASNSLPSIQDRHPSKPGFLRRSSSDDAFLHIIAAIQYELE